MQIWPKVTLLAYFCILTAAQETCNYCPVRSLEAALRRFDQGIELEYAGQEEAVEFVRRMLVDNLFMYDPNSNTGNVAPLLLHFTGPTGVGKSLLASLLKEALFSSPCGMKKIHLDVSYRSSDRQARLERIDLVKKAVVEQLEVCPRSLVLFDDFQWAHVEMILALKSAFDEANMALTWRDKTVKTNEAIFIFASDLESSQKQLSENMTLREARNKVSELAAIRWNNVDQGSAFGKLFVSTQLVPFVPLSTDELRKVIHVEIHKLSSRIQRYLSFSQKSTIDYKWLGKVRFNSKYLSPKVLELLKDDLREYNARAVRNLIDHYLLTHSTTIGACLLRYSKVTEKKGWFWGSTRSLLSDVDIVSVDENKSFSVSVAQIPCIVQGEVRSSPKSKYVFNEL